MRNSNIWWNFFSKYGLLVILIFLIAIFSIILPKSFPTLFHFKTLLADQSVVILLAFAQMIPMVTDNFNLSLGYFVGLSHILMIKFIDISSMPWGVGVLILLGLGLLVGWFLGFCVTRLHLHSFIASLGVGTVLYGISFWVTGGTQVIGKDMPKGFLWLSSNIGFVPLSIIIALIVGVILYIFFEYMPMGRYFYAIGSNSRSAELVGIPVDKIITLSFIASSLLTVLASIILASQIRVGQVSVGPNYLLGAFTGAFLGATVIKPGRMNIPGTFIAVLLLGVTVSGLQQLGAAYFVDPLFNGAMLIVAVAFAKYTERHMISIVGETKQKLIEENNEEE